MSMQTFAANYYLAFGLLTIFGGLYGYLKVKSQPSLIAGLLSGLILIFSFYWMSRNVLIAASIGCVVSLLLFGRFFHVWQRTRKTMPSLPMMILSLGGLSVSGLVLLRVV